MPYQVWPLWQYISSSERLFWDSIQTWPLSAVYSLKNFCLFPLLFAFGHLVHYFFLSPLGQLILSSSWSSSFYFFSPLLWEVPSIICVNLVYPLLECPAVLAWHDIATSSSASVVCYQLPSQYWKLRSYLFLLQNSLSKLKSPVHFNVSFPPPPPPPRSSILLITLVSLLFIFYVCYIFIAIQKPELCSVDKMCVH